MSGIDLTSATTVVLSGSIFKMMRAESIGAFAVSQNESPIDCACRFGVAVSGIPMLIPVAPSDNHSPLEAGRQSDQNRITRSIRLVQLQMPVLQLRSPARQSLSAADTS